MRRGTFDIAFPAGTLYLPLIARLFPDAALLFAVRDPRDVVLSCFRSSFAMNALTYAFTDLAETARCYAAAMALADVYRRALPIRLLEVRYERLVDDFEAELGRICGELDLEMTPTMTDVASTAREAGQYAQRAGARRTEPAGPGRRAPAAELAPILPILATPDLLRAPAGLNPASGPCRVRPWPWRAGRPAARRSAAGRP